MDENNIIKLWRLCQVVQDFCETHNDCRYCPFYDDWKDCLFEHATGVKPDEFYKIFPENIPD